MTIGKDTVVHLTAQVNYYGGPRYESEYLEAVCGTKLMRKDLAPSAYGLPNRVDCVSVFSDLNDPGMFPEAYWCRRCAESAWSESSFKKLDAAGRLTAPVNRA